MLLEKSIKISLNLLDWNLTNIVKYIIIFPAEDMQKIIPDRKKVLKPVRILKKNSEY